MKEAVSRNEEHVFYIDEIKSKDIVGILFDDGEKVMLLEHESGVIGLSSRGTNIIDCIKRDSKVSYIETYKENKKVFVFESMRELYKWMSE